MKIVTFQLRNHFVTRSVLSRCRVAVILQRKRFRRQKPEVQTNVKRLLFIEKSMETNQDYLMISLRLLGALGLLIYGMKMMSDALQKMAGAGLRHVLARMTTNRLTGMLTGTFVTCDNQYGITDQRSIMLSIGQLTTPLGVFVGYIIASECISINEDIGWKFSFVIQSIIIILMIFLLYRVSENLFESKYESYKDEKNTTDTTFFKISDSIIIEQDKNLSDIINISYFNEIISHKIYLCELKHLF